MGFVVVVVLYTVYIYINICAAICTMHTSCVWPKVLFDMRMQNRMGIFTFRFVQKSIVLVQ